MAVKKIKKFRKGRTLRLEDKTWREFASYKPKDKSWQLFIQELLAIIGFFKKL